ncbi:MAG: PSD1 and planctomycete cytochrome C domain-containing protein [Akkermansiaceae bacterium]
MSVKIASLIFLSGAAILGAANKVDFQRQVRPILSDKCFFCHGTDSETREADLRLDMPEGAYEDLGGYAAIVPGKVNDSELYLRITSNKKKEIMPPPKSHKSLTVAEVEILKKWIEQGAEYDEHWAYQDVKKVEAPAEGEIDFLVKRRWEAEKVKGSDQASRETLIKRLSWDLRGVPPTAAETQEFLADQTPQAWNKLVDRFLADQKYGERMAVWWLDLVRYADTIGYHSDNEMNVSPYRDYVIDSFNRNKPFSEFTTEQLAGDLLPNPTLEQKIASGYNRLLQTTEEGGAQEKEYRAIYAADRVRNISEVWLGSTLGCAQCHDHKYDPFTTRDFYSMAAFFADIKERGIGKRQPNLTVPSAAEQARVTELHQQIAAGQIATLLQKDAAFRAKVDQGFQKWVANGKVAQPMWSKVRPAKFQTPAGTKLVLRGDGTVVEEGKNPAKASYRMTLPHTGKVAAVKLEALTDASFLTKGGFSRANGNFVLTGVELKFKGKALKISKAKADFEQSGFPVAHAIDRNASSGWAVGAHEAGRRNGTRRAAFYLDRPVELSKGEELELVLHYQSQHAGHTIGRLGVAVTDNALAAIDGAAGPPPEVLAALKSTSRTAEQLTVLRSYYVKSGPEVMAQQETLKALEAEIKKIESGKRKMLVSEALPTPRMTRVLPRGNWMDDSGDEVQPAVPEFLQKGIWKVEGRRANRLDLANWILDEKNPLTARSIMNRVWRLFFGRGLSGDVTDLGGQGQVPSHPELLDWLAADFQEHNWDLKRMVKKIVTSEVYRQSSLVTSFMREKDPANELITRQGRWRVDAEFVRDAALEISGLLNDQVVGGGSVKPYQPAGFWQHLNFPKKTWKQSQGGDLYRRSVYTFLCRTFPHPSMVAFDAPSREECTAERARSNIPQQALAMLNDPIFVEASRVFGARIAAVKGELRAKIEWAMKEALSRPATKEEVDLLLAVYKKQLEKFNKDEAAAREFLSTGEWPAAEGIAPAEAAAWGQVGRVILNAYETTSRF